MRSWRGVVVGLLAVGVLAGRAPGWPVGGLPLPTHLRRPIHPPRVRPGLGAAAGRAGPARRIVVSANHRFLQYEDGSPFFWLGDTAWLLFQQLDRAETLRYLDDRERKGFDVVQVMLLHAPDMKNAYGAVALDHGDPARPTVTQGDDPARPGQYDYWDHVDWVVRQAARRGIQVALVPAWGSLVKDGVLGESNATAYATFLAERYRAHPNIVWVLGGDIRGDVHPEIWRAMGRMLKRLDPGHLITFHPFGRTSSAAWFHDDAWLDFDMFQSGHRRYDQDTAPGAKGEDNWRYVAEDYARTPTKPTLDGEPSYEKIPQGLHDLTQPYWTDADVRRYAYWSVFAGAFGHTYGDNAVFQMYKPGDGPGAYGPRNYWYEAIDDPGAGQMQHLKRLMLSRPFLERIPDQSLIAGENGTRYERVIATRGSSYLFAYTYTGRLFDVRMGVISGKRVRGWWYDPRDGRAREIGGFANRGVRTFTPPGSPGAGNDWVLVLDDDSQRFPAPGRSQ